MPETYSRTGRDLVGHTGGAGTDLGRVAATRHPRPAGGPPAAPGGPARTARRGGPAGRRPARRDVAELSRRLATLAGSGLPLGRALTLVAGKAEDRRLAEALRDARAEVALGGSLADALSRHPALFSQLHVAIVRAGEFAGSRGRALADAAGLLEQELAWRDRIRATVIQPLAAFAAVMAVVTVAAAALAPGFGSAYTGLAGLPLPTRALLGAVQVAWRSALPLVAGTLPAALLVRLWLRSLDGRARADALRLRLPVLGPLERAAAMARSARGAAALLRANMPDHQALRIAAEDARNAEVGAGLRDAQATAAAGGSPAVALHARDLLPAGAAGILIAGERSGALDTAYAQLADHLDGEVDATLRALAGRLGPTLVAVVATLVTAILVTLYLPVAWLLA